MAIKLNERFSLEGNVFDWTVVTRFESKDKDGKPKIGEKRHYFPRLSQVASYIVEETAKGATDVQELIDTIRHCQADITAKLGGLEERVTEGGSREAVNNIVANGEGTDDAAKKETTRATGTSGRRRTRKKKAS